uniref:Uncharacterized protein n=1 Tax=Cacopsylla melanoneura TaxID=428564 RepID=A0A8D9EXI1_9HEMI
MAHFVVAPLSLDCKHHHHHHHQHQHGAQPHHPQHGAQPHHQLGAQPHQVPPTISPSPTMLSHTQLRGVKEGIAEVKQPASQQRKLRKEEVSVNPSQGIYYYDLL